MHSECTGKLVKQEVLNNVKSTLNKNTVYSVLSTYAFERC